MCALVASRIVGEESIERQTVLLAPGCDKLFRTKDKKKMKSRMERLKETATLCRRDSDPEAQSNQLSAQTAQRSKVAGEKRKGCSQDRVSNRRKIPGRGRRRNQGGNGLRNKAREWPVQDVQVANPKRQRAWYKGEGKGRRNETRRPGETLNRRLARDDPGGGGWFVVPHTERHVEIGGTGLRLAREKTRERKQKRQTTARRTTAGGSGHCIKHSLWRTRSLVVVSLATRSLDRGKRVSWRGEKEKSERKPRRMLGW